ncbi:MULTISPECIES: FkbM family methyltransferase [Bradyrhizobium]|uniref:Methyltransferase, FkbM family n=2 Tax=Bradyrhizobium TaxID=374 RepID=A0ABY0Q7A7_9BRAD|nr:MULTISPECIES: FkbM family methyltransferase [Bradyrhizobium]SDJ63858.1 methyltransferase, FkbM family [Bradyrhizobium ottawaense]SEC32793.1 methyltransferase, FkbM family [Bradyrhizobium lablabi]
MLERFKIAIKTALHATNLRPMYFGSNFFDDVRIRLPGQRLGTVFDVGANQGQSAAEFRRKFPTAEIHCFEPNPDCCRTLESMDPKLNVHQIALGNETGRIGFDRSNSQSEMYTVTEGPASEQVELDTLDNFVSKNGIEHIDFLKIDTEGYDLNVIRGASRMFEAFNVDIIQAEVSMNSDNTFHVPFVCVHKEMEQFGYRLFGIYEQVFEWGKNAPYLRRSNVVYIAPKVWKSNKLY